MENFFVADDTSSKKPSKPQHGIEENLLFDIVLSTKPSKPKRKLVESKESTLSHAKSRYDIYWKNDGSPVEDYTTCVSVVQNKEEIEVLFAKIYCM